MIFKNTLSVILFFLFVFPLFSQKMEVIRTKAVDRETSVTNVFIDADNQKWVGNRKGLFRVLSPDQGETVQLNPGEWSLLQTHDGNHDLRFPLNELLAAMGTEGQSIQAGTDQISTATYNAAKDELWIGTNKAGLFELKTKPALRLTKRHHTGNSKLPSDKVNTLLLDVRGQLWAGTFDGTCTVKDGNWTVAEKGFSFSAFAPNGVDVWAMGDNLLWKVNAKGKWEPKNIDENLTEGDVADIAFDQDGLLWVVSQIVARYDPATEEATVFGPAIGFTSQDVKCVAVDQNNGVWIGTNDKGLYLIQKSSTLYVSASITKKLECNQPTDVAAVEVKADGGTPPYNYIWENGATTAARSKLSPGEYRVTVTDSKGRTGFTIANIDDPNLKAGVKKIKDVTLAQPTPGSAEVVIDRPKAGFKFLWDNGETTQTATKLEVGKHTVTTTDPFGCTAVNTVQIEEELAGLKVAITQTEPLRCDDAKKASLRTQVTGGKAPYSYQWNTGQSSVEKTDKIAPGQYAVTVTDANGETATASITVAAPPMPTATAKVLAPASTGNADGKAVVEGAGGTGKYQYRWNNGDTTPQTQTLAPGTHAVTVTDENGCHATATVTVSENILALSVTISPKKELLCADGKDAAMEATVAGGKGPFRYAWSSGGDGAGANGLPAGNVSVTVTDATGTTATNSFSIKQPKEISLSASVKSPASTGNADGKASAKASGGTGEITFRWSNGESGKDAQQLAPGEHTVSATDANGCVTTTTVVISENILALGANISQTKEIKCAGEKTAALEASVSGGKGPFTYRWSADGFSGATANGLAAGEYSLTVTDAVGSTATAKTKVAEPQAVAASAKVDAPASTGNADGKATVTASGGTGSFSYKWDNGETAKTAVKLSPGTHPVTVTDAAGCTATASVEIQENILALGANISQIKEIKCAGEKTAALEASVSGGKGPFTYRWSADGFSGATANGLSAGEYSLTVTDAVGSTATAKTKVAEPQAVAASAKVDAPASTGNADGKATVTASGGTGSFTYKWDNGETAKTAVKLSPGTHPVTVTDAAGCTATASVEIQENILALGANISQTKEIKCAGEKTAALKVEVNGGKGPFSYTWSQPGMQGETAGQLAPGRYTVTVADATGKSATASIDVAEPKAIEVTLVKNRPATTAESNNGTATVRASGGTPKTGGSSNYDYKWDNNESAATAVALPGGPHRVTVTDANGCTAELSVETKVRIIPELSATSFRAGETINLNRIYFQTDSTAMDPSSLPTVDELFEFLQENANIVIEVGGHTNGIPTHEYCDQLSTARAKSVAEYLLNKGIPAKQLRYKGYGKRNPIATNSTEEGRAKNQRVEIKVLEVQAVGG